MTITILTIDSFNHGNRLQNYALSTVLKRLTKEKVRTGRVRDFGDLRNTLWYPLSLGKALVRSKRSLADRRAVKFLKFTHKYIPTTQLRPSQLVHNDDIIVVGSDQCWNPSWDLGARSDGLQCVIGKPASKKLSYAASFGITEDSFPDEWQWRYSKWLQTFDSISVREDEGVKIVEDFSGVKAQWVLDPTMLLEISDWEQIEKRPKNFPYESGMFCLKYVLGADSGNAGIDNYSEVRRLPVFVLHKLTPEVGPAEFLWLIHHAHAVFTDSFHGSAFSLLFHKRLFVISRNDHLGDLSSRFETLKRFTGFEKCIVGDEAAFDSISDDRKIDWGLFEEELNDYRATSLDWLKKALEKTS